MLGRKYLEMMGLDWSCRLATDPLLFSCLLTLTFVVILGWISYFGKELWGHDDIVVTNPKHHRNHHQQQQQANNSD